MTKPNVSLKSSNIYIIFLSGVAAVILLMLSYHLFANMASERTKVSCHKLKPTVTQTEYCVYYTRTPGLLADTQTVLVGPSADRGIVYTVPYQLKDVKVEWDATTDALTLVMPNTRLTIDAEEYVDTR